MKYICLSLCLYVDTKADIIDCMVLILWKASTACLYIYREKVKKREKVFFSIMKYCVTSFMKVGTFMICSGGKGFLYTGNNFSDVSRVVKTHCRYAILVYRGFFCSKILFYLHICTVTRYPSNRAYPFPVSATLYTVLLTRY